MKRYICPVRATRAAAIGLGILATYGCGGELGPTAIDLGEAQEEEIDYGQSRQGWIAREHASTGRTWGVRQSADSRPSCLDNLSSQACTFLVSGSPANPTQVIKVMVNDVGNQWTAAQEALIAAVVDTWISGMQAATPPGSTAAPWSWSRVTGGSDVNIKIEPGGNLGALDTDTGHYAKSFHGSCTILGESLPGTYSMCGASQVLFSESRLQQYFATREQQGDTWSTAQRNSARSHIIRHALLSSLGIGAQAGDTSVASYTNFNKISKAHVTSEEQCRIRNIHPFRSTQPGDPFAHLSFELDPNNGC